MEVILWNLILHDDCVWNSVNDGSSLFLEEFDVFVFIETSIPSVSLAILSAFDYEYDLVRLHILYYQRVGWQKGV